MKILAINGSPRKNWNTAQLLDEVLEGAASQGAETELIHLVDLNFKGCVSCFACKRLGSPSYGKCALNDELTPVLNKIEQVDALVLGSPIYLGTASSSMRACLERLLFQYLVYDDKYSSLFNRRIATAMIYTMGVPEDIMTKMGYESNFRITETLMNRMLGTVEALYVTDTYQFDDYAKYMAPRFDPLAKAKRRAEQFPLDCQKAYELGIRLTTAKE
jgi:multimeric flavodoxin WrbA